MRLPGSVAEVAASPSGATTGAFFDLDGTLIMGHPRPTNPQGRLAAIAAKRGWPVLRFTSRGGDLLSGLRSAAAALSLVPVAMGAVGVGLLSRNRRRGVNFFTGNAGRVMFRVSGVKLNVPGAENLCARRPAVCIFNHRNNFDPVIAAALVGGDWIGVGKKELAENPPVALLGKLTDAAFIDRQDAQAAVESLGRVEQLAREGLSVVIALEGSRLDSADVGLFKKGPFRLAMAAGIPVVPIVIRNAEVIAGRDSTTFNPGTVDVAVGAPIPVDAWTVTEQGERIAEVRQFYIDVLQNWPQDTVPEFRPTASGTRRRAKPAHAAKSPGGARRAKSGSRRR
ncbi:MAG: hypothetical protein CK429_34530 [Mycobacterium sp.]|nr:MAG: hypothetical protein CK429_34530 [Mycobacterium sp.]PJE24713.1 MAG: hypothetical protein CK431_04605 [Mycobacterium sp.]